MEMFFELLIDNLKAKYSVHIFGRKIEIPLLRPVFYDGRAQLEKGRIYLTRPDTLPPRDLLGDQVLLICTEGFPSLSYQHGGFPLLVISNATIMHVFNELLSLFERYALWHKALSDEMIADASIQKFLRLTAPLLMNDITVIDDSLHIVAMATFRKNEKGEPESIPPLDAYEVMPVDLVTQYESGFEVNKQPRTPFFAAGGAYCINFYIRDVYYGNISLYPRIHPLRPSDTYIMDILASFVLEAIKQQKDTVHWEASQFLQIVRALLDGGSVDPQSLQPYESPENLYICFCIYDTDGFRKFSPEYVCHMLAGQFSNLAALPDGDRIIGVRDTAGDDGSFLQQLTVSLRKLHLRAGVSAPFSQLRKLHFFRSQAIYAYEFGCEDTRKTLYFFRDYTLKYLLVNSTGIFPTEYLCPQGLLRLRKYDQNSHVDYWGTLRCYLDQQMNITETSQRLSIHRNTLLQRIGRIEGLLQLDLRDPEIRLWLRLAIYLYDLEYQKQRNAGSAPSLSENGGPLLSCPVSPPHEK